MRMTRNNDTANILANLGLKPSLARLKILSICMDSTIPLDVESVSRKMGSRAHLATVYRTLEKFVQLGLLEKIDFQEGKFRYEYMQEHHHHAICRGCGSVQDIGDSATSVKVIENHAQSSLGFKVTKHLIELFGICAKCQQKGNI